MPSPLTVSDPLNGAAVTVHLTLPPSDAPRADRPVLVSLGAPGAPPVTRAGRWGALAALLDEAWQAHDLRRLAAAAAPAVEAGADTAPAVIATAPTPPPRPARNLTLF